MRKIKIKRGDLVVVIAGKDYKRGHITKGKVLKIFPNNNRVIVSGINLVKKHLKPSAQKPQGEILKTEASIHISNIALLDPQLEQPTRIKYVFEGEKKIRISKKSGSII